ncbi:MAG: hypothetical protein ACK4UJ_09855 [Leptonema sp. (in: bacteria)]
MFNEKRKIKIQKFEGTAFLKYQNTIEHFYGRVDKKDIYILIQKAHLYNIFFGKYWEDKEFSFLFLSLDVEIAENFFSKAKILESEWIQNLQSSFLEESSYPYLVEFFKKMNSPIIFFYFTITKENQEQDSELQISEVYSAGYPPLILLQQETIQFPIRSGIPYGINEMLPKKQTLEIPPFSNIYLHTPLNEKEHNIKELHYEIIKNQLEKIPHNLILFEYSLNE